MKRQSWLLSIVVLALIGGTAALLAHQRFNQKLGVPGVKLIPKPVYDPDGKIVGTNSVDLPESILNYQSEIEPISQVTLGWLPKDTTYGQRVYKAPDGFWAALNVVLMGTDRTSIHRPEWCLQGIGIALDPAQTVETVQVSEPFPYELPVRKLTGTKKTPEGVERIIFLYWLVADHQLTQERGQMMRWMARDMLRTGVLQRWAYVTCVSWCPPGQETTTLNRMKELIAAAVPKFQLATGTPAPLARNP